MRAILRFFARPSTIALAILACIAVAIVSMAIVRQTSPAAATVYRSPDTVPDAKHLASRAIASSGLKPTAFQTLKAEVLVPAPLYPFITGYRLRFQGNGSARMQGTVAYAGCLFGKRLKVQATQSSDKTIEAGFPASDPIIQECVQRRAGVFIETDRLRGPALKATAIADAVWSAPGNADLVTATDLHIPSLKAASLQKILTFVASGGEVRLISRNDSGRWDVAAASVQPLPDRLELLTFEPIGTHLGTTVPMTYVQCPRCKRDVAGLRLQRGAWKQWEFSLRSRHGAGPIVDVNLDGIRTKGAVSLDAVLVQDAKQCRVSLDNLSHGPAHFDIVLRPNRYAAVCGVSRPELLTVTVYANGDESDVVGTPNVTAYAG